MAPQKPRPESRHHSRPSSDAPSPTKSPRKSGDKRHFANPDRRTSEDPERKRPADPEKRRSADPERRRAADPEKRRSRDPDKRRSRNPEETHARDPDKRHSRDPDRRKSHQPEKHRSYGADYEDERDRRERRRSAPSSPKKSSPKKSPDKAKVKTRAVVENGTESGTSSNPLSLNSLAKLNVLNEKAAAKERKEREKHKVVTGRVIKERIKHKRKRSYEPTPEKQNYGVIGGAALEDGFAQRRGGFLPTDRKKRRALCLAIAFIILLLIILIPVGVLVIGKQNRGGGSSGDGGAPDNSNLAGISQSDIPSWAKGGYLDPFTWYDTADFNVTFTNDTVGGLPVMGLNSEWDDSVKANDKVPALTDKFEYGKMPIRGINVGGWLALEPFITPSMFNSFDKESNVVDEWTLCKQLGTSQAAATLEKHYSSFINKESFSQIRDAGFDHVRIPFSYWAVTTYSGDPYVPKISWRYLLRGIEYARQNGLRVKLDVHGLPGSQNGWNHSGRQGAIGWLNGTDGALNGQRSLDFHKQLATFFAQDRYKNVVTMYGLANEPKMISLPTSAVLEWTTNAIGVVREAGIKQAIVFGDGFLGLQRWQGKLTGDSNLVIDAHSYVIFNVEQIAFDHRTKLDFACEGWAGQMKQSSNKATG